MKTRIKAYLLILLTFALACAGENQKSIAAETLGAVEQENEIGQEKAKAKPVNIKDIFLLLPENVLPESDFLVSPITVVQRKKLLERIAEEKRVAERDSKPQTGICDVKNGYMWLMGMAQSDWEASYWNLKDNRKLVIVNQGSESGSILYYFFYENGKLTQDHNYRIDKDQTYTLSDFIDVSQLTSDERNFAEKQFSKGEYVLYYGLPQKGTSIHVRLDDYALMGYSDTYEIPYEATKEVTLKWINEKWVR